MLTFNFWIHVIFFCCHFYILSLLSVVVVALQPSIIRPLQTGVQLPISTTVLIDTYTAKRQQHHDHHRSRSFKHHQSLLPLHAAVRYGPVDAFIDEQNWGNDSNVGKDQNDDDDNELQRDEKEGTNTSVNEEQRIQLRQLIDNIRAVTDAQHIPSLLTKNIELVLSCTTTEDGATLVEAVLEDILTDAPDADTASSTLEIIDIIVSFGEEFVLRTSQIQKQNQLLLGRIIKIMSASYTSIDTDVDDATDDSSNDNNTSLNDRREDELDRLFQKEREKFTPGFLRHIDNECNRIQNAPVMTKESIKLLETLRIIQRRVLEEVCLNDLGETAQVLGQIVGYETTMERLTILDAGLLVRGINYGKELYQLTKEALAGFQTIIGGADPDLVSRVQEIHTHLHDYIQKYNSIESDQQQPSSIPTTPEDEVQCFE